MFAPEVLSFDLTNPARLFIVVDMSSFWRTPGRATLRDIALVCVADALVGASFGALAVSGGILVYLFEAQGVDPRGLGGLLAAFHSGLPTAVGNGPLRRRVKHLPWWRMSVGLVTGFVLYWTFIFLSLAALPQAVLVNPFTALVSSLLGGWLGLNVFTLVLKRLHLLKTADSMSVPASGRAA